jgi:hypothetical protein
LLVGCENLVGDDKIGDGEDDVETADCAGFFLINYAGRSAEGFAEDNEIEDGEDGVETADCAGFFLINHIGRGAEGFAEDGKIGGGEDNIEIAGCEKFFINYADRCAVSLHSANLVIIIAAVKTASMYRS